MVMVRVKVKVRVRVMVRVRVRVRAAWLRLDEVGLGQVRFWISQG